MSPPPSPRPPALYAALYVSRAVRPLSEADLADILFTSRRHNAEKGLTGQLIYAARDGEPGTFVQWLEGEDWRVRELLYGALLRDGRHALFGIPFEGPITRRVYPSWTMGYERLEDEDAVSEEIEEMVARAHALIPPRRAQGPEAPPPPKLDA